MNNLLTDLSISVISLTLAIRIAWKKRKRLTLHLPFAGLSVFWMLFSAMRLFLENRPSQGWEGLILVMIWYAILLVLGLCIMYGSKTIHFLGRDIIILVICGVLALFIFLTWTR